MNAIFSTLKAGGVVVALAALVGNGGCAKMPQPSKMFSLENSWPFRDKDAPQEGVPSRLVCTWTDTVMTQPGQKPQRGFGGRIMFYEKDEADPILVDGQFIVYAFDENGRDPTDNKPTRRYVFPSEQMALYMSKSAMGASYSFWLPWDEAGGPKTDVSLICRFEPTGGAVVTSEQTRHRLPGSETMVAGDGSKKPPQLPEGVPAKPAVQSLQSLQSQRTQERNAQLTSYEATAPTGAQAAATNAATGASSLPPKQLTATTINLPNSFQMPSAASLMHQAAPTAGAVQNAAQTYAPTSPNQPMPQRMPAVNQMAPPAAQPAAVPQTGQSQSFAGVPAYPQVATLPATTPLVQSPTSFSTTPATQMPAMPQAQQTAQQAALQQQMLQQQLLQQQAQQQRMLPPQAPLQMPGR